MKGEAISPLFKKLVHGFTFGEIDQPQPQVKPQGNKVTTIHGQEADMSECFLVVRKGKVVGWDKL